MTRLSAVRRIPRRTRDRLLYAAPLGAAAVVVLFGLLLLDFGRRSERAARDAERYHQAVVALIQSHAHMRELESHQRGYLLTGDSAFLASYELVYGRVESALALVAARAETEAERAMAAQLEALATRRLAASAAVVQARHERSAAEAAVLITDGPGRAAMAEFSAAVAAVVEAVDRQRATWQAQQQRRYLGLLWLIVLGTAVSAGSGVASGAALRRHAQRRTDAARRLASSSRRRREQQLVLERQAVELEHHTEELQQQAVQLEEANEALAEREQRFRALVEHAPDVLLVIDERGRIGYASPNAERSLGRAPGELAGVDALALVHPDELDDARRTLRTLVARSGAVMHSEFRLAHADGSWRVLAGPARNLLSTRGVEGIVVNALDVTAERSMEAQLRQAQKMEAVGQLAGGVAHDFNNLLTTIHGYTTFAAENLGGAHPAHADLQEVLKAVELASALTRQLLAFSRRQVTQPELLDLNDVVEDAAALLRRLVGPGIELRTRLATSLPPVRIDPTQIRQVLMNLAINARDAMPDGGTLVIATAAAELSDQHARSRGVAPGRHVAIGVTDSGVGMTRAVQERIFEPFFTTKEQGKGTGLGLSTTYGIVRQAGGSIWVYSEPGRGSVFKIYLPVAAPADDDDDHDDAAAAAALAPPPSADADRTSDGLTVLLVEDDATVRAFARRALERAGCTVLAAESGDEALRLLAQHDRVSVVVTDVVMAGMDGTTLGRLVGAQHPALRVLYTSGYPRDGLGGGGTIAPHVAFLEKPYTAGELVRRVTELAADPA